MTLRKERNVIDVIGRQNVSPVEGGAAVISVNVVRVLRRRAAIGLVVSQVFRPRVSDVDL